ncbi:MAG: transporter [Myxococcales bacterium]|nr:transporter [Myxococcales bacterium]
MRGWPLVLASCLVLWLFAPGRAHAQVSSIDKPAFGIERFWLEPGPGGFLAGTDARVLEPSSMHVAAMATLMNRPIVLTQLVGGEEASVPVRIRLGYEVAVARGISQRLQLGVALPIVAAQDGDRLQGIGLSEESLDPVALGDTRLHAKLSLQEEPSARLGYGLSLGLRLPTGNENHFAGEAGLVVSWSLLADYQGEGWRVAAKAGLRLRTTEVILLSPARAHANELVGTFAGEYRHPRYPLGAILEYSKVRGDDGGPSPGEARVGLAAYLLDRATLKIATARGTSPGEVGSPAWRVMTIFEYSGR